jgi:FAD/FMN-containing dehydrogenase
MTAIDSTSLKAALSGRIHEPGDARYVEACTLFNAAIARRPRLVVRCGSVEHVEAAVAYARVGGLPLAVRGGGHSAAGWSLCDDGVVIDVRDLDRIDVDVVARTVTVGGGALTGAVDQALCEHGLATVTGRVSTTGIAGFTLGGGSGVLERRFGFAVDNLLAAQIVTASGAVLRADHDTHADLFWALRGGGGNFGVVTELTFRTHPVGPIVTGGLLVWPGAARAAVTRHVRDYMAEAPEHVGGYVGFLYGPDDPSIPSELRNEPIVVAYMCHSGPPELAESELAPLRSFGPPAVDSIDLVRYSDYQRAMDDPPGYRNYMTSEHLASLDDAVIDEIVALAHDLPRGPGWIVLFPWGGAVTRPPHDTPIGNRTAAWVVHPGAFWEDPGKDGAVAAWVRRVRAGLAPHATGAVWLNWIGDEGEARVRAAFGDGAHARLRAIKAAYDPDNLFRSNHNVVPGDAPA